jgi:hypothetical protein
MKTNKILLALLTASVSAGTAHAQTRTYTKSSKVPAYKLVQKNKRVTEIPKLNIGNEKEVVANIKPLSIPEAGEVHLTPITKKVSPALLSFDVDGKSILSTEGAKAVTSNKAIQNVPELKDLKEIPEPTFEAATQKPD